MTLAYVFSQRPTSVKRGEEQPPGTFSVEEAQRHEAGFRMVFKRLLSFLEGGGMNASIVGPTEYALESSAVLELLPEVKSAFQELDIIRQQNLSSIGENKETSQERAKQYVEFLQTLPRTSDYCKRMLRLNRGDFFVESFVGAIRRLLSTAAYEDALFQQLAKDGISID